MVKWKIETRERIELPNHKKTLELLERMKTTNNVESWKQIPSNKQRLKKSKETNTYENFSKSRYPIEILSKIKHLGSPHGNIIWMILKMENNRIQTNGQKKSNDDEEGFTSERWHR